jgi:DNA invertase Pin-like site-specific DNA recombinase
MKRKKTVNKVVGYLRVSTVDQDTQKNEAAILKFANDRNFGQVEFVSEKVSGIKSWKNRRLKDVVDNLQEGDALIVPELSRLGRSLVDVLEVLNTLTEKSVKVYSVKENFQLNGDDMQSKVMRTMLGLFAEIEHDLIQVRVKEGLAAAKAQGRILGRPKGIGKSRLDPHREEIIALIKNGASKPFIAKRYGVSNPALWNWLKNHKLDNIKPEPLKTESYDTN